MCQSKKKRGHSRKNPERGRDESVHRRNQDWGPRGVRSRRQRWNRGWSSPVSRQQEQRTAAVEPGCDACADCGTAILWAMVAGLRRTQNATSPIQVQILSHLLRLDVSDLLVADTLSLSYCFLLDFISLNSLNTQSWPTLHASITPKPTLA